MLYDDWVSICARGASIGPVWTAHQDRELLMMMLSKTKQRRLSPTRACPIPKHTRRLYKHLVYPPMTKESGERERSRGSNKDKGKPGVEPQKKAKTQTKLASPTKTRDRTAPSPYSYLQVEQKRGQGPEWSRRGRGFSLSSSLPILAVTSAAAGLLGA